MDAWDTGVEGQHPLVDHMRAVLATAASQDPRFFAAGDEDLEDVRWYITRPCGWDAGKSRLAVRDGQSRALSNLLTADRVLTVFRALNAEIADDAIQSRRLRGRLRATAEQDTGLPCIVFDHEVHPSSPRPGWAWARHTTDILEYVTLGGTTDYTLRFSHEPPWSDDPLCRAQAALADVMKQVLAIRDIALAALGPLIGPRYSFARSVPPNEASPCGVLRLAAPIVPGAPSLSSWAHKTTMTLAA